jgi:hypothetical protein
MKRVGGDLVQVLVVPATTPIIPTGNLSMERDIPPNPYSHPNESYKTVWVVLVIMAVPDLLRSGWSVSTWLAEVIGVACSLPVFALVPPRLGLRKVALLSAVMCLIIAVEYLAHTYLHLHR